MSFVQAIVLLEFAPGMMTPVIPFFGMTKTENHFTTNQLRRDRLIVSPKNSPMLLCLHRELGLFIHNL